MLQEKEILFKLLIHWVVHLDGLDWLLGVYTE